MSVLASSGLSAPQQCSFNHSTHRLIKRFAQQRCLIKTSATIRIPDMGSVSNALEGTLVSFDVDGTLIKSIGPDANKLHKEAFAEAFKVVFGLDTTIDVAPHHGSTDPLILVNTVAFHGIDPSEAMEKLPHMKQVMIDYFIANADVRAATGIQVLPGVIELLTKLREHGAMTCLVTGNLEPIGWAKMKALGIIDLFTANPLFGGFGSDFCSGNQDGMGWRDRAEFIRIANKRAANHPLAASTSITRAIHVGDAPMDVRAAAAAGVHPLGVTTGIYTTEQLLEACPEATIVENLHCQQVLEILGIPAN